LARVRHGAANRVEVDFDEPLTLGRTLSIVDFSATIRGESVALLSARFALGLPLNFGELVNRSLVTRNIVQY
jgi:hypothetical protein